MSMPTLNRRLQILIDEQRYAVVEREAAATGMSVGEFVRRALDAAVQSPARASRQQRTLDLLLAAPRMEIDDAAELRDLIEETHVSPETAG